MVAWECGMYIGAKLCVAREVIFRDVLRIDMSEFDEDLKEPSSYIDLRSCVSGMFVIITSAEPS